ncbi:endonuclease/exonuclease/phosphatase family protein [Aquibacillus sediminis]|uniref:endonuclease/exonuclease/phosphatase family protein n=1 Tax=Aquibacillus sediminis TaxID=2574734 RepID=UPI0011097743|nr:endonuclease/exonuclease/phosphatase family protein [Aquibacillus sediminis]
MKLLTLNCHSWQEENQSEKIDQLAKTIHDGSYDVIALQEVSQLTSSKRLDGQVKQDNYAYVLQERLHALGSDNYQFVWDLAHLAHYEQVYEEGVAIMTKHPIQNQDSFFVSDQTDLSSGKTRKIVEVTIDYGGKAFTCYSCHLGWWYDELEPARHQMDRLLHRIPQHELCLLMGDFNCEASKREEGYDYLLKQGLLDTYQLAEEKDTGITVEGSIAGWATSKADKRIDYIFVNQEIEVNRSNVIFNGDNQPVVSDHYGVEVYCSL